MTDYDNPRFGALELDDEGVLDAPTSLADVLAMAHRIRDDAETVPTPEVVTRFAGFDVDETDAAPVVKVLPANETYEATLIPSQGLTGEHGGSFKRLVDGGVEKDWNRVIQTWPDVFTKLHTEPCGNGKGFVPCDDDDRPQQRWVVDGDDNYYGPVGQKYGSRKKLDEKGNLIDVADEFGLPLVLQLEQVFEPLKPLVEAFGVCQQIMWKQSNDLVAGLQFGVGSFETPSGTAETRSAVWTGIAGSCAWTWLPLLAFILSCRNMAAAAVNEATRLVRFKHTASMGLKLAAVEQLAETMLGRQDALRHTFDNMGTKSMTLADAQEILLKAEMLKVSKNDADVLTTPASQAWDEMQHLAIHGEGAHVAANGDPSYFGVYQMATNYETHMHNVKNGDHWNMAGTGADRVQSVLTQLEQRLVLN